MSFPKDFVWGAATAAYQIEGAAFEDGKGPSVWDDLCRRPGAIWNGHTGDVACDHYHRYAEDVALMQWLGLKGYRLSISWSRLLPAGIGRTNPAGLDFYDRLIDALLQAGITPYVTLFHWDYPSALYQRGGWLSPDSSDWFAEYTGVVVDRLSDRVQHWIPLNEPQCFIGLGHLIGEHAPGLQLPWPDVLRGWHNALLAHGKSVQTIRARSKLPSQVGTAPLPNLAIPLTESAADIEAARQATFAIPERSPWITTWFFDPVFFGRYPEDGLAVFGADVPEIGPDDMATIAQPLDFLGYNNYHAMQVRSTANGGWEQVPYSPNHPLTAFRWYLTPDSLYWGSRFLSERYQKPIYITENGLSGIDWVALDGKVHDPQRIDFTTRYLRSVERACAEGIDVRGYFHWSLMDNFEWAQGYKERFGLIYVDFNTGQRIPKDSAEWYRQVIATNGAALTASV